MGRLGQISDGITGVLLAQRGALFCWVPVCLAGGIGIYFGLRFEPTGALFAVLGIIAICFLVLSRWLSEAVSPFAVAISLCCIGFLLAGARAHSVAGPILGWR